MLLYGNLQEEVFYRAAAFPDTYIYVLLCIISYFELLITETQ